VRGGEVVRVEEMRLQVPDGRTVPVLVNSKPQYSLASEITGAIVVLQDITAIEESDRSRAEFLAMVSHELKSPLSNIKAAASWALGGAHLQDDPETRDMFQLVNEQADHLTQLVNNLLDMSSIEAGALSVTPEPMDLIALLEESLASFMQSGKTFRVMLRASDELPLVKADRRRIGQVVNNLLNNAAKFSATTAPIHVELEDSATHVTVRVKDSGRGFAPEKKALLFRKISQIHEEGKRQPVGTGLGLAICKGIVEAHGGRIWG